MLPNVHSNYACSTCGKSFMRLAAKENHERLAHPSDEAIIRASCQQRMSSSKKDKPKKSPRMNQDEKEMTKNIAKNHLKCQLRPKQASVVKSADNDVVLVPKPTESFGSNPAPPKIDAAESAYQSQVGEAIGHCKKLHTDVGTPAHCKRLSVLQNKNDGYFRCSDCYCIIGRMEQLFEHECSDMLSPSKLLCSFCGCSGPECACPYRFITIFMKEKLVKGLTCQELVSDEVRNTEKQPSRIESTTRPTAVNEAHLPMADVSNTVANHAIKVEEITSEDHHEQAICPHCKKVFKNDLYLNNHLLTHDELKQFDCYFCRLVFHSGASLKHHLKTVHNHLTEANCKRPYGDIIKTEVGLRFRCSMCPKTFTCRSNRKRHERWHFGIRPYSCDVCGVAFRQRWNLITHRKSKKCEENRMTSSNKPEAKTPSYDKTLCNPDSECLKSPTQTPSLPGKGETGLIELTAKYPLKEEKLTNFPPSKAKPSAAANKLSTSPSKSLSTSTSQIVDLTLCRGEKFQIVNTLPEENPLDLSKLTGLLMKKKNQNKDSTKFVCQVCGKACKTNRNLVIHKRIHTGERPYSCNICSFTFRQSHHRKAHMLSKHGLFMPNPKPPTKEEIVIVTKEGVRYQCHYCNKLLMSRSGRRKHERWHLGLRPHRCNTCGSTFKQRQHLKKHQRSTKCKSSQNLLRSHLGSAPCQENQGSHAAVTPLTPLHMVNPAKKEKTYQQELLDANDNLAALPVTDTPQVLDMPSALGLISTEKLKAISKEQSSNAENSILHVKRGYTQCVEHDRIDIADHKAECLKFPGAPKGTRVVQKHAGGTDQTKETKKNDGNEEKREYLASIMLAESERQPEKQIREDGSALCMSSLREEVSDIEEGEVFDMTELMASYDSDSVETDVTKNSLSDEDLKPLDFSGTSTATQNNLHSIDDSDQAGPVQCKVCGQHYKSKQNLAIHMRLHTGMRPFSCTRCPKSFIQPHHLKLHMKSKHNVMISLTKSSNVEEAVMTPEGLRYKCQHCPKLLASRNGRRKHERWHLGLRPYKCDKCGKAFKQSHHMKRHKGGKTCRQLEMNHCDDIA